MPETQTIPGIAGPPRACRCPLEVKRSKLEVPVACPLAEIHDETWLLVQVQLREVELKLDREIEAPQTNPELR
jgi:hypothetical protein